MASHTSKFFSEKHAPDATPDPRIQAEILQHAKKDDESDNALPCAVAFQIAKDLNVPPVEVGKTLDLMNFRLVKCQLGLFGYKPKKKILTPQPDASQPLKDAIHHALINERLSCKDAWEIASRLDVSKMTVSGVCEALSVRIKPCQLGAF